MSFLQRLRYSMVKPDDSEPAPENTQSAEEIEADIARIDDRERGIGLLVAPLAAVIGLVVSGASVSYAKNHGDVGLSTYKELTFVLLGMSVLILVMALLRKRLFLGLAIALFGLGIFNLRYWGFGFPFIMVGAWYLVRAYRTQQNLRRAGGGRSVPPRGGTALRGSRPRQNKRYTPPA
jgi:hypothetical protein